MSRLMYDNYYRIRRSFLMIGLIIGFVLLPITHIILQKAFASEPRFSITNIEGLLFLPMMFAVAGGHFLSRDYINNTIRNKLIVGHTRVNIYLSNFFVLTCYMLFVFAVYEAVAIGVGIPVLGTEGIDTDILIKNVLFCIPLCIACSAITIFVSMTIKNNGGMVLNFILYYAFIAFGLFKQELPELLENKIIAVMADFIPTTHLMYLDNARFVEDAWQKILYSVIVTVVFTIGGIEIFKRADLK